MPTAVAIAALSGGTETVAHLAETVLGRYARTTALLVLLVAAAHYSRSLAMTGVTSKASGTAMIQLSTP